MSAWATLPNATPRAGMITPVGMLERAPNAAAEAAVLPVEAQMKECAPSSMALAAAMASPRSLNEPVGLQPSSLSQTSEEPSRRSSDAARTSGVSPSPMVRRGVASLTGRNSQ